MFSIRYLTCEMQERSARLIESGTKQMGRQSLKLYFLHDRNPISILQGTKVVNVEG